MYILQVLHIQGTLSYILKLDLYYKQGSAWEATHSIFLCIIRVGHMRNHISCVSYMIAISAVLNVSSKVKARELLFLSQKYGVTKLLVSKECFEI